ncbi:MAG: amino acid adenylation domain-containing protein [Halanaerobiales bacterium]|nr:amino acid adenylation domain-containing protein [Halanaerobiales bacterium]
MEFQSLHEKISYVASQMPNKIAIERGNEKVSFMEFEESSNQIANFLSVNIKKNKNIPVMLENSIELIEAILGVIKCGGVFAPIDPEFPESRIKLMIDKIDADWVITRSAWLDKLDRMMEGEKRRINALVLDLNDTNFADVAQYNNIDVFQFDSNLPKEYQNPASSRNKHCYIYFTSGSTGKPKAVLGRHRSLKHFIDWEIKEFGIDESFKVSQIISPSFDPFLRDIFVPLCTGATLVIPENREIVLNPLKLKKWIDDKQINLMHTVPSLFKALMAELDDANCFLKLEYILLAGELLRGNDIKKFFKLFGKRIELVNLYGPTETTLAKLFYRISEDDIDRVSIPVGKPIDGVRVMILNSKMQKCAVGSVGEIYIRTPYISSGYYNDRDLTREVFLQNPFTNNPQDIIYKTGDLGITHPNKDVEIVGRVDHQVKIRGVRIEPGEIENQIVQFENVNEAVVTAREEEDGSKYLCAYIILNEPFEVSKLREALATKLPDHMIPAYFVQLEKMPLTPNGKINRKSLPDPAKTIDSGVEYLAPQSEIEEVLVKIWSEIFGVDGIGVNHNFFDMGGHSLRAMTIVAKIQKELNLEVRLKEIFVNPTIKKLSAYIENSVKNRSSMIAPLDEKEYKNGVYPMSSAQKRLSILNQLDRSNLSYNIPRLIMLEGVLNYQKLEQSFITLINRHETLRTSFESKDGDIVQRVHQEVEFKITYLNSKESELDVLLKQFVQPFDLSKAPLLRVWLAKLDNKHALFFDMHHIISDGASIAILIKELVSLYEGKELLPLPIQYKDFSKWQNDLFTSDAIKVQEKFWLDTFKNSQTGEIPVLNMPTDYMRLPDSTYEGSIVRFEIDAEITGKLKALSKETNATMFMIMLASYNVWLSKYSGQEDIVIGSPMAGRHHAGLESIIGMFLNTLALRNFPEGKKTFKEFLEEVGENTLKAFDNQDYQFEQLVEKLNIPRDLGRSPLFDVMFVMQDPDQPEIMAGDLKLSSYLFDNKTAKYDLVFYAIEDNDKIRCLFNYRTALFSKETIQSYVSSFKDIFKEIIKEPEKPIYQISKIVPTKNRSLSNEYTKDLNLTSLLNYTIEGVFYENVDRYPENIAIEYGKRSISYAELDKRSNAIANSILKLGIEKGSRIGVMTLDRLEIITSILGILKSGYIFVPFDLTYPEQRLKTLLQIADTRLVLTDKNNLEKVTNLTASLGTATGAGVLEIKIINEFQGAVERPGITHLPDDDTYLYFTSGSTGQPKGIVGRYQGLLHFSLWERERLNLGKNSKVSQLSSPAFDPFLRDIFVPLLAGGTICIPESKEISMSGSKLARWIDQSGVSLIHCVPSVFKLINQAEISKEMFQKLQYILLAGERVTPQILAPWYEIFGERIQLVNVYGPTEVTLFKACYFIKEEDCTKRTIPVGKALDGSQIIILDDEMNLCSTGVSGEIYLRTPYRSRGYFKNEELTSKVFVPNPFNNDLDDLLYKTGDIGRIQPDGNLEFIGRTDNQVKVRGVRIEPGEIENTLLKHPAVLETVVIDRKDDDAEIYLAAYFVLKENVTSLELREFMIGYLPEYMIPSYFVSLDRLPLSPNGKIDYRALPEPEGKIETGVEYEPPKTTLEVKLVEIWSEILGRAGIGVNDNFFILGGHSLKATSLIAKIYKELNVELPLRTVFKYQTIRKLAKVIEESSESTYMRIEQIEEREYYPVSSAQKRLYLLQQMENKSTSYNIPKVLSITGELSVERLTDVFQKLIQRHESLRTSFETIDGEIVQRVHQDVDFEVTYFEAEESELSKIVKQFVKPFDLKKAPLLRVGLVKQADNSYVLLVDIHHIISDGTSTGLLVKEFASLYEGKELLPLRLQYKEFVVWQNELFATGVIKEQEAYWLDTFAHPENSEFPVLNLPTDYPRPREHTFEGSNVFFAMSEELTGKLVALSRETETTLFMVLLASYNILLSKYSDQKDIVVGSPIAGRHHPDLESIIGIFVNTLALRNHPTANKTFKEFLQEVKENSLSAFENQDYQFEQLVEKLNILKDLSRHPLFDVVFNMQNPDRSGITAGNLKVAPYNLENRAAKYDLILYAFEGEKSIQCIFNFCTVLFKKETIQVLASSFIDILKEVVEESDKLIYQIGKVSLQENKPFAHKFQKNLSVNALQDQTLEGLFYNNVDRYPEKIAVESGQKVITYAELDQRSNAIANSILDMGFEKGSRIGIMTLDRLEIITALLSILKSGYTFVPFDLSHPEKRLETLLQIADLKLILTDQSNLENVTKLISSTGSTKVEIRLIEEFTQLNKSDIRMLRPEIIYRPDDEIYLYFTSGSTGKPKGIVGCYQGLLHFIKWEIEKLNLIERCKVSQLSTPAFDAFLRDIFVPLIAGGTICIPESKETSMNGDKLAKWIDQSGVTLVHCVPSIFKLINQAELSNEMFMKLQYILMSGERVTTQMVDNWYEIFGGRIQLINLYGPTETTMVKTYYFLNKEDRYTRVIPVGKAMEGSQIMILDEDKNLCLPGIIGEIYIRTPYRTKGYFRNPELTSEIFIPNPFNNDLDDLLYKTGDLGRILYDGNLEFIGRIDNQVKIRGVRIEPGEIENMLLKHPAVLETVVMDRKDSDGETYLASYLVLKEEVSSLQIREFLTEYLPEFMIPGYFITLDRLPLTPNGKIDYKALPEPREKVEIGKEFEQPTTTIEIKLAQIWSDILRRNTIGVNDSFFVLGGHSLKAIMLINKIHREFDVELSLKTVFTHSTIRELALIIEESVKKAYSEIEPVEEREYYPLSSAQKRLYVLHQMESNSTSYNMPKVMYINGELSVDKLSNVFFELIERHESLRTSFVMIDGEVVQKVHKDVDFEISFDEASEDQAEEIIKGFVRPFDLSKAPLLRVKLVKLEETRHLLLVDMHHIISDGTSVGLLVKEFVSLYGGQELLVLPVQYKDFAVWQNTLFANGTIKEQENYWLDIFADSEDGEIPILNMPTDYPRPLIQSFRGDQIRIQIGSEITEQLKELATQTNSTMYMVLVSAFYVLLSKYSGQEDIVIGSPTAGRRHADLQNVIGMFVNTLAMRNAPSGNKTFVKLLAEVRENTIKAYDNEDYQFEELVEKLNLQRDLSRNPLFDVMFSVKNFDRDVMKTGDLEFVPYSSLNNISKFDMTLDAVEGDDRIAFIMEYCVDLYKKETIEKLLTHYVNILRQVTLNPEARLAEINMLSETEKQQILYGFNATQMEYEYVEDKTLHELFVEQAEKSPDNLALVFEENKLTYRELNIKTNQLAHLLREKGVQRDEIIGIMAERSIDMVIAILGVLKAGGAYMPIDPEYPVERIKYMLEDSGAKILIAQNEYAKKYFVSDTISNDTKIKYDGIIIDLQDRDLCNEGNLVNINKPTDLAYIMYTSGSTGNPKGVMLEHQGVVNLSSYWNELLCFEENRNIVHMANVAFDGSISEIFPPLLFGATIYIIRKEIALDRIEFIKFVKENRINIAQFVPVTLKELLTQDEKPKTLNKVVVAGDKLEDSLKDQILSLGYQLSNHYGPTEGTVDSIVARCELGKTTIGKPIANNRVYILDKDNNPTPVGVPGELCVAGVGLARGYLNKSDLTAEKFVQHPFLPNERIYRTGDLSTWQADGNITFIGRRDHQVKIRGYRIEPEEIESQLLKHEFIKDVVVIDKVDANGSKYLCAYIVSMDELTAAELRAHLLKELPDYMIPSYFVQIDNLLLTSSGKVDRKSLPNLEGGMEIGIEYVAPINEVEEKLIELWQEVLGMTGIGINHNFFEVGGHSLKAMVLVSKIHKELNAEVPLGEVFKRPTIRELAQYIAGTEENLYSSIKPVDQKDVNSTKYSTNVYPASSAQKRLYIPCQFKDVGISYNMPGALMIEGALDLERLENAFRQLVLRHETLRTSFELIEEEIFQKIHHEVKFSVSYIHAAEEKVNEIVNNFVQPFDLSNAPLFRVQLVKLVDEKYLLLFDIHHIISDGVSTGILVNEFVSLYEGQELLPLPIQYKDFSVWQNDLFTTEVIIKQKKYWLDTFSGKIPVLNLPTDYSRPTVQSFEGSKINFELDKELTGKLKAFCKEVGVTLYMALLASFNVLMLKYTGQEDIVVGSPIAGRPHADLQGIIGMFVNTLTMRNYSEGNLTFKEFSQNVKTNALKAYENQDYPFEQLVEELEIPRDISRNPLFDVVFVMQNTDNESCKIPGLKFSSYSFDHTIAKFDLYFTAQEINDIINFNLIYCTKLFRQETMERLSRHLIYVLRQIVENSEIKLFDITLYSQEEKDKLLGNMQIAMTEADLDDEKIEAEFEF